MKLNREKVFNAARLRRVVTLLDLGDAVPQSDEDLLAAMGTVLGIVARKIEEGQKIIKQQALTNLTLAAEAIGALPVAPAPKVPCPICGGEAIGHMDKLRAAYFVPASLVKPEDELTPALIAELRPKIAAERADIETKINARSRDICGND